MTSIQIAERILVWTALGEREIQLCLGDITALPKSEAVDFIMVSAFLGDYSAMHGTVIGALKHNLGIDVRQLAMDKLEDLRSQFNCWISRKLHDDYPYRQLICFERKNCSLTDAVKEVFRAMMPAFNNTNKSVITPLLGTGHQQCDTIEMLDTMLWTAAKWMWLGMPLQQLKIVVYSRNPYDLDHEAARCLKHFRLTKEKIEKIKRIPKEPSVKKAIYLMFYEVDVKSVDLLKKCLKKKHHISFLTKSDVSIRENSWQYDLSEALVTVERVVPVISSNFVQDASCLDEFNVALCCNRLIKRNLVVPVLIERVPLPTYMNMVQWLDCRDQKDDQFELAASRITELAKEVSEPAKMDYDVFISYSHKQIILATELFNRLKKLNPPPNVFFDYNELTAGVAWQQALYKAIDNSRCMIAIISLDYQKSAMCQEELNLGLAKCFSKDKDFELAVIYTGDVEYTSLNSFISPLVLDKDTTLSDVCASIGDWLSTGKRAHIFSSVSEYLDIDHDSTVIREHTFKKYYHLEENGDLRIIMPPQTCKPRERQTTICDVYISHSLHDHKYATFLEMYLKSKCPDLKVHYKSNISADEELFINAARCIVVILSSNYITSVKEVEQFNLFLSKERQCQNRRILNIIKVSELLTGPLYFKLVPCDTSLCDEFWRRCKSEQSFPWEKYKTIFKAIEKKLGHGLQEDELFPLLKVACDVQMMLDYGSYLDSAEHTDVILHNVLDVHLQAVALARRSADTKSKTLNQEEHSSDSNTVDQMANVDEALPPASSAEGHLDSDRKENKSNLGEKNIKNTKNVLQDLGNETQLDSENSFVDESTEDATADQGRSTTSTETCHKVKKKRTKLCHVL